MTYRIIPDEHGNPILTNTDESISIRIKGEQGMAVSVEEAYVIMGEAAPQEIIDQLG